MQISTSVEPADVRPRKACRRTQRALRTLDAAQRGEYLELWRAEQQKAAVEMWPEAGAVRVMGSKSPAWEEREVAPRKPCREFTRRAKRGLNWWLATLRRDHEKPVFITLTFPREVAPDPARAKEFLEMWFQMARRRKRIGALWKMEPQKDGTVHFHAFVWGVKFYAWQRLAVEWADVITERNRKRLKNGGYVLVPPCKRGEAGKRLFDEWLDKLVTSGCESELWAKAARCATRAERIRTYRGVKAYAAKYLAKECCSEWKNPGRFWGVMGRDAMPRSRRVMFATTARAAVVLRRLARRYYRAKKGFRMAGTRLREVDCVQWARALVWAEGMAPPVHDFVCDDGALGTAHPG